MLIMFTTVLVVTCLPDDTHLIGHSAFVSCLLLYVADVLHNLLLLKLA